MPLTICVGAMTDANSNSPRSPVARRSYFKVGQVMSSPENWIKPKQSLIGSSNLLFLKVQLRQERPHDPAATPGAALLGRQLQLELHVVADRIPRLAFHAPGDDRPHH